MSIDHGELIRDYGKIIIASTQQFNPNEYKKSAKRYRALYGKFLPKDKESRIADIGCGDGHFLYFLKTLGYRHLEGVDGSEDRLRLCRKHVLSEVYCDDVINWLSQRSGSFDVLSCHHVIEHFPPKESFRFVRALCNALKPDGILLLTTPNASTPWAGYNLYHDLTHYRLFTSDTLIQLFATVDMSCEVYPEGPVAYDFISGTRLFLWKLREMYLKTIFRIDMGGIRGNQTTPLIVSNNLIARVKRKIEK